MRKATHAFKRHCRSATSCSRKMRSITDIGSTKTLTILTGDQEQQLYSRTLSIEACRSDIGYLTPKS